MLLLLFLHENEWDERIHIIYIKIVGNFFSKRMGVGFIIIILSS